MDRKTLVVAGAGRGLGRAIALHAILQGYRVAALARSADDLASLTAEAGSEDLKGYQVDLIDADAVKAVIQQIATAGTIRGLVHCAATWTGGRAVMDLSGNDFRRSFDLNFFSALYAIQATVEDWQKNPSRDLAIVAVGATASLRGGKNSSAFATAKGAIRSMTQSLAKELGPEGVHVAHIVLDGLIDNPRTRQLNQGVASERYMQPDTIAKSILSIIEQPKDCWTFELDMRPYNETW